MYGIGHEAGISSTPTCQASLNDHPHDCVFPFVPQPPLQTHSYGVFGDAYCDVGMPDHAAGSQFTLLDGGHEEYSQLRSAKNSHSQRDAASIFDYNESPQQDSFLSAFSTAQGSGGVGNESPCWPVHSSEQYVQQYEFTTSAGAAAAAALCSSGALHRRTFRMVPSGLSRESTMTHFGRPSGGYKFSPDDSMGTARQPFSNDMATHNDDFLAPLVPGSNKKRKALDAGTHATPQGLLHTTESSLFMESIPTLLPHLGGSSLTQDNMLQSLQPEPAAMQPGSSVLDATPLHAAGLGTGQDYFTVSTSPKRQRLSRASSSWESSQFAAAALPPLAADRGLPSAWLPFPMAAPVGNHTHGLYPFTPLPLPTYTPYEEYPQAPAGAPAPPPLFHPPTNHPAVPQGPTDAPEHGLFHPHALPQAVQSAPQQTLEALSGSSPPRPPPPPQTARPAGTRAGPQASRHSRTRFPPQASRRSRLKCASQAQPLVDPHANPRAAPEAPAHAAPQEPPPQAAIPTTPQEGPVSDQRVRPQAGRVVWAKCGGYPWWPAIVSVPIPATSAFKLLLRV